MFKGVEGARAWLAWGVVVSHIVSIGGLPKIFGPANKVVQLGHHAVGVFIIISGFVITHLVLSKHEPYGIYIARRALRIFPAYLACLVLGILATHMTTATLLHFPFSTDGQLERYREQIVEYQTDFWPHLLVHLTMLHGTFSNEVLRESQYMLLPPARSVSLEWQFYIVAPFVIMALAGAYRALVVAIIIGLFALYSRHTLGTFDSPSLLFGAGPLFLLGIATRFLIEKLPRLERFPTSFVLGLCCLPIFYKEFYPIVGWAALVGYMLTDKQRSIVDGAIARWAGARSYSVYVVHYPLICLAVAFFSELPFAEMFILVCLTTVISVVISSELLFRFVETPMIRLGRKLGNTRRISGEAEEGDNSRAVLR